MIFNSSDLLPLILSFLDPPEWINVFQLCKACHDVSKRARRTLLKIHQRKILELLLRKQLGTEAIKKRFYPWYSYRLQPNHICETKEKCLMNTLIYENDLDATSDLVTREELTQTGKFEYTSHKFRDGDTLLYFYLDIDVKDIFLVFDKIHISLGPFTAGKHIYITRHKVELPTYAIYWTPLEIKVLLESDSKTPTITYYQRMYGVAEHQRIKEVFYRKPVLVPVANGVILIDQLTVCYYKNMMDDTIQPPEKLQLPDKFQSIFQEMKEEFENGYLKF
jgi:hypothetical protein